MEYYATAVDRLVTSIGVMRVKILLVAAALGAVERVRAVLGQFPWVFAQPRQDSLECVYSHKSQYSIIELKHDSWEQAHEGLVHPVRCVILPGGIRWGAVGEGERSSTCWLLRAVSAV